MKLYVILPAAIALAVPLTAYAGNPKDPVTISELTFPNGQGEFIVTSGADALGCSAGTIVYAVAGLPPGTKTKGNVTSTLTCTVGSTGTITINFEPSAEKPGPDEGNDHWNVTDASGDFAGLHGRGDHSWNFAPNDNAVGTYVGLIHYEP